MAVERKSSITQFNNVITFSFAAGIMLSPDMLSMIGKFFGSTGYWGFPLIGLSMIIYILLAVQYRSLLSIYPEASTEFDLFHFSGYSILLLIPIWVKITAFLFLATGFLVSSGFVFNEVFVYWFPNFGFAFLLLFILIGFQFFPQLVRIRLQSIFTALCIIGLLIIIGTGFIIPEQEIQINTDLSLPHLGLKTVFVPLLFFIGMDMGIFAPGSSPNSTKKWSGLFPGWMIPAMASMIILWGLTALNFVGMEKLSQTSISHIIIARNVLGDTGRLIMGGVIIFGTLSALHALLTSIHEQTVSIIKKTNNKKASWYAKISIVFWGLCVGILMARGLAGYDILETLISGSLILWLIAFSLIPILILFNKKQKKMNLLWKFSVVFLPLALSVIIFIATDEYSEFILKFVSIVIITSLIAGSLFKLILNHKRVNELEKQNDSI